MFRRTAWTALAALAWLAAARAGAQVVTIDFDTDPGGGTITAPGSFDQTTRLTNLYAPLGVTFSGPGGTNGGAILNQLGNFGVNARSGINFLAFNRIPQTVMMDGGSPLDPETVMFATAQGQVSVFASGGDGTSFRMDAFDAGGALVGTSTGTNAVGAYVQLSVTAPGIRRVVLTETGGDMHFVYDDLSFTPVPEPTSLGLAGMGAALWLARRRGQKRCQGPLGVSART